LEAFASFHGADFYRLPRNSGTITLAKKSWEVPAFYSGPDNVAITPLKAGEELLWKLED
jgi:dihydroorotase